MKRILVKACTNGNLGDDLFIRSILDHFISKDIHFDVLVYNLNKYKYLEDEYKNVSTIQYPLPNIIYRSLSKLEESISGTHKFRKRSYEKVYSKMFKIHYYCFINIGGSQFAEFQQEDFILSFYIEQLFIKYVRSDYKCLLNINFGPYVSKKFKDDCYNVFEKYDFVSFRDKVSIQLFRDIKNIVCFPDIAMSFNFSKYIVNEKKDPDLYCINPICLSSNCRTFEERKKYIDSYDKMMIKFAKSLLAENKKICLIGFSDDVSENKYINELIFKINNYESGRISKIIYNGQNLGDIVNIINSSSGLLSTRFHSFILGVVLQVKQVVIGYDSKISNYIKSIDYEGPFYDLNLINADKIILDMRRNIYKMDYSRYIKLSSGHFKYLDNIIS